MRLSDHSCTSVWRGLSQPFGASTYRSNASPMVWCSVRDSKVSGGGLGELAVFSLLAGIDDNDLALPSRHAEHYQRTFFIDRNRDDHNCRSSITDRNCSFRSPKIFSFRGKGCRDVHPLRRRAAFMLSPKLVAGRCSPLAGNSNLNIT